MTSARWAAVLLAAAAARGCYSSVAPAVDIPPAPLDSGLPVVPAPTADACAPRKPWEGPGVTSVLPLDSSTALVISGDRYFVAEFETSGDAGDPALGSITTWHDSGNLRDLWFDAPAVVGVYPWDDPGVTAAFQDKATGSQIIVNQFRRWVHAGKAWAKAGNITDDWTAGDAGPIPLDGAVPWNGPGVTAAFFTSDGTSFVAISQDKAWTRRTDDPDPRNWTWSDAGGFLLSTRVPWSTAPVIAGQHLYDGKGVTAAYYVGDNFFVISRDKMWVFGLGKWIASGALQDMRGWGSAPSASCGATL
jgi:hypothetical protein